MISDIFNWFDGKKTLIGAIIRFLVLVIGAAQTSFNFQVFTIDQLNQLQLVSDWLIGVGLLHKGAKTNTVNKIVKRII